MPASTTTAPTLRVARIKERCAVLGPGLRAVIWFHGCSMNCPECIAREMNRSPEHLAFTPVEMFEWVRSVPDIEGVTLSGGEPFEQDRQALLAFLMLLRRESDLSVFCYTGYTLQELRAAGDAALNERILGCVDLLIDGRYYDETRNRGLRWRGSENQQVYFLTGRYAHLRDELLAARDRSIEIEVSLGGKLMIAGVPGPGFVRRLAEQLDGRGAVLNFDTMK